MNKQPGQYGQYDKPGQHEENEQTINAEHLNIDSTLDEVSKLLQGNDTLILDVGNNYFEQTDAIFDTLVMRGYNVNKTFRNGRNQIIVVNRK